MVLLVPSFDGTYLWQHFSLSLKFHLSFILLVDATAVVGIISTAGPIVSESRFVIASYIIYSQFHIDRNVNRSRSDCGDCRASSCQYFAIELPGSWQ